MPISLSELHLALASTTLEQYLGRRKHYNPLETMLRNETYYGPYLRFASSLARRALRKGTTASNHEALGILSRKRLQMESWEKVID